MHVSAEAEIHHAVVAQDGAVDRHLAPDRDIGIPVQHLVAEQIERELRPGHTRTHHVEGCKRHLAYHRSGKRLHWAWEHADQTTEQTDQLGGMSALEKLRFLVYRRQQFFRRANIKRKSDRNQRNVVPRIRQDYRCRAD